MKRFFLYLMVVVYVAAGINHLVRPDFYLPIMPPFVPYPMAMVLISGVCEVALGLLLLPTATRSLAAWGIIALLIAVFPANLQMAVNFHREHNPYLWVALLRLPFQFVFIGWAWKYTSTGSRGRT